MRLDSLGAGAVELLNLAGASECNRENGKTAMAYLLTAKFLYADFTCNNPAAVSESSSLDSQHIMTLFFLAQCCGFLQVSEPRNGYRHNGYIHY